MKKKLLHKKMLATNAALLLLLTLIPMTARAETINTVTSSETITKTSTVYVGEVVVDGESKIKYLYSGDLTLSVVVRGHLLDALNGMADGDYATLLESYWPDAYNPPQHFAFCSDSELTAAMDENWSSALYVGTLYFPDKSVTAEINTNLYDVDEGFRAALDAQAEERSTYIQTLADAEKCIVSHHGANSTNSVYYTVEDGQIVKHVDTNVTYDCEVTTVIYTKVELFSGSNNSKLGDVNGDGDVNVTDVALLVGHILGNENSNFIIENADVNGDVNITVTDVTKLVSIILEGNDDTPKAYLTCPDNNHPHMIDLGLPSGILWACCNVGATNPEEYGGYYSWGETEEKDKEDGGYEESNYLYYKNGEYQSLGDDIAGTRYDVAHVKWGGSWVMPSFDQINELLDNCTYEWTEVNDVEGVQVTGPSGGKIFLPPSGYINDGTIRDGDEGGFWSSTQVPSRSYAAYDLDFDYDGVYWGFMFRNEGHNVRPVWVP